VDLSTVKELAPHVVVIATGSTATVPRIPVRGANVVTAREIVGERFEAGKTVVVVGGGDVGCETAEYLAVRGRQVTILEMLPDIANELIWFRKQTLVQRLMEHRVEVLTNSQLVSVDGRIVSYRRGGIVNRIEGVDTVVMATGATAENRLGKELIEAGFEVRMAGDCVAPGNLGQAVRQGFEAGITIE
jgi:pyruvate/2-oxoglutarate dehydrogenase complex dihydrolipoamide dehydrogenase (E3) component